VASKLLHCIWVQNNFIVLLPQGVRYVDQGPAKYLSVKQVEAFDEKPFNS